MLFLAPHSAASVLAAAGFGFWLAVSPPLSLEAAKPTDSAPLPILEVIKVYGKIAGSSCFGKTAPKGSSCQVTRSDFERIMRPSEEDRQSGSNDLLSKEKFYANIESLQFEWPLKPYGVEKSESKTAIMNKGAETALYMQELEQRGLYDKRNPTGPLPTSLRPNLNRLLQQEGVSQSVVDLLFHRLGGNSKENIQSADALFQGREAIDYYDFLEFLGKNSITWN